MLPKQALTVGKYYTNNTRKIVREVVSINDNSVKFNTYHLDTGNSCGSPSECTKTQFMRWANREASPAEMAKVQYQSMDALFYMPQVSRWEVGV